ncbi:hypothetical protein LTR62_002308 [Meristemomyces frigidus]|uniref:J domain-containing protein n=1 Tax=Meristemomyces frigidus TaxID=1508187 RepID=A0AAN7TT72_9PEZI|nr:hypothetical protein LTR62_002308 [Meristemomyces frigidus]
MTDPFNLSTLRAQVARDVEIYKAEKQRFNQLRDMQPDEIPESDRKAITNWSRASISEYNKKLEQMQDTIKSPTKEERQVMGLLNELVVLGDQIAEFTSCFARELEERFGRMSLAEEGDGEGIEGEGEEQMPTADGSAGHGTASSGDYPSRGRSRHRASSPSRVDKPNTAIEASTEDMPAAEYGGTEAADVNDDESALRNPGDSKGVYAMLGVPRTASMADLKRQVQAYRDKLKQLHPDRNRDDDDTAAAARFVEFKALCAETVLDEEKRSAYDGIQTGEEVEKLTRRVKGLTAGA